MIRALLIAALLGALPAAARAEGDASLELNGDVKSFTILVLPYEHAILYPSADPMGMGALDLRLKLHGAFGEHFTFKFHPQLTASSSAMGAGGGGLLGRSGGGSPEAIDLSHTWPSDRPDAATTLTFRVDRLLLKFEAGSVAITLGRQPISFGTAFFFSPMDLVSPFSATTIDQEYRTGIDAARLDAYVGESTTLTLVAAYAGADPDATLSDWRLADAVFAARAGTTFGVWDVGAFGALNHEDVVLGLDTQGSIGPVGVRAEATVTVPPDGGSVFYRAVLGANGSWEKGSVSAELYWQSNGELESEDYLWPSVALADRLERGDQWVLGRYYAAATLGYELHPLLQGGLFTIVNLADPSALVGPSLSWSIADEASLDFGLYLGVGKRPDDELTLSPTGLPTFDLGSEFGLMPATAFVVLKAYL
ncbi:MAG: hypothetical protein P1V51_04935 [Deltaproteobacteria bacterium]|nr:hypothetical protein [Deltaproteobacteria bacterium]